MLSKSPGEDFLCPMLAKVIENNGPQFASKVFESFLQAIDIQHKTSTPLWPQANTEWNVTQSRKDWFSEWSLQDHNSGVVLFNRDTMSKTAELTARIALRVKQMTKKQQRNKEELITLIKGREQKKTA